MTEPMRARAHAHTRARTHTHTHTHTESFYLGFYQIGPLVIKPLTTTDPFLKSNTDLTLSPLAGTIFTWFPPFFFEYLEISIDVISI